MPAEDLLPPYTAEERFRELCMRNRFLCGRVRHKRKKRREVAEQNARHMEKPLREGRRAVIAGNASGRSPATAAGD
jgi:hypothetical protein